jgi:hypothetical protein
LVGVGDGVGVGLGEVGGGDDGVELGVGLGDGLDDAEWLGFGDGAGEVFVVGLADDFGVTRWPLAGGLAVGASVRLAGPDAE